VEHDRGEHRAHRGSTGTREIPDGRADLHVVRSGCRLRRGDEDRGRLRPYHKFGGVSPNGASAEAAVGAAARTALNNYLLRGGGGKGRWSVHAFLDALGAKGVSALDRRRRSRRRGRGQPTSIALRFERRSERTERTFGAVGPVVAGAWQVVAPATSAQTPWVAFMKPFLLKKSSQFRLHSPSALSSTAWANDFNETKAYGSKTSTVRTSDQTAIA